MGKLTYQVVGSTPIVKTFKGLFTLLDLMIKDHPAENLFFHSGKGRKPPAF